MYENIKRVTEAYDECEVNRLLSEGWKLLHIRPVKFGDYQKRGYLMGNAETDADTIAQAAVDEINRRTKELPRSPILPAAVEPLKPKATTVRVDDGTREVKFQNHFGEEISSFRFRPADIGLIDRYKKVTEVFPTLDGALDELSTGGEEYLQKAKTTLCQLFDFMFDGPVSKGIFRKVDPFSSVGSEGKLFCEVVLDAIVGLIESEFAESLKRRETRKKPAKNAPRFDFEKRMESVFDKCERLLDALTESVTAETDAADNGGATQ